MKLFIAQSLDGFISGPNGSLEHLKPFEANDYGYDTFIKSVDAVVIGRSTFDAVVPQHGWTYPDHLPGVVLTTRPLPADLPDHVSASDNLLEIASKHPNAFIDGGALTIAGFLQGGAVTEAYLFTLPVMLGSGTRLFGAGRHRDSSWVMQESRSFPCGTILGRYTVTAQ